MTTGPRVIGITQLQGHRNDPCRLLSLPILACSPRPLGAALVSASRTMASPIWPHGSNRRKRVLLPRASQGRIRSLWPGIVTSHLLLSKCPPNVPSRGLAMSASDHTAVPSSEPALLRIEG